LRPEVLEPRRADPELRVVSREPRVLRERVGRDASRAVEAGRARAREALLLRESAMRIALLLLLAGLAGWAFWPIADARYAIVFDPEATRAAKDFVAAPAELGAAMRPNAVVIVAHDPG